MAALVASSASAEWEMVYMVSWVAMPTMAALVVMLARWKGKKPSHSSVPSETIPSPLKEEETSKKGLVISCSETSPTPPQQSRKRKGKPQKRESNEKLIRRVTSCPDFAVVRVLKPTAKSARQASYSNLKDRRLQEEISKLADKLLTQAERRCDWGQDCRCELAQACECGLRGGCTCGRMNAFGAKSREWFSGAGMSVRGRKACTSLEALWAKRVAANRTKQAESFQTKGNRTGDCEIDPRQAMQAGEVQIAPLRGGERRSALRVGGTRMGRLEYYDQLRPAVSVGFNTAEVGCLGEGPLARWSECNVVKFWGGCGLAGGALRVFDEESAQEESYGVWSVSTEGVVESWDSRAGQAPQLRHMLQLQNLDGVPPVEGLDVIASQLLVQLASGREISLDGRKLTGLVAR